MKKVFKIIGWVLLGVLVAAVFAAVVGRGVTGKWNPAEWGQSTDISAGVDGKDGETPYIGENGNWFIGEVDTGVKAAGQDGKDGVAGTVKLYNDYFNNLRVRDLPSTEGSVIVQLSVSVINSSVENILLQETGPVVGLYSNGKSFASCVVEFHGIVDDGWVGLTIIGINGSLDSVEGFVMSDLINRIEVGVN